MDQKSWTNLKSVDQSEPGVEPGQHRQFYVIDEQPQEGRGQLELHKLVELHKPVTQEVSGSRAKVEPQQPQVV